MTDDQQNQQTEPNGRDEFDRPTNIEYAAELTKEINEEREKLRAELGEGPQVEEVSEKPPVSQPGKEPETGKPVQAPTRDEKGRFVAGQAQPGQAAPEPEEEAKPETPYAKATKAEKDAARLARTTQALQREVEQSRQEAAAWRARAEQGYQQPGGIPHEEATRFNSEQFARAADEFAAQAFQLMEKAVQEEDPEVMQQAQEAFKWAQKAQQSAQQAFNAEQEQAVVAQQENFLRTWQEHQQSVFAEAKEQGIDLLDEDNEVGQALVNLLDNEPVLSFLPDGFRKTWELYQLQKTYMEAEGLREKIKDLEGQVANLTRGRTPSIGTRKAPKGVKFEDMTDADQRAYLREHQWDDNVS